ncbi:MAG: hypothetical protein HWE34_00165 [Methylocystaceae bacterium]|nr:hypothetical protein [Methylocystaceae bacterium]
MNEIQDFIINYITENASHNAEGLNEDTNFIETGLLDSYAILNLFITLESVYNIKFTPQDFARPELHIIGQLSLHIKTKMSP